MNPNKISKKRLAATALEPERLIQILTRQHAGTNGLIPAALFLLRRVLCAPRRSPSEKNLETLNNYSGRPARASGPTSSLP